MSEEIDLSALDPLAQALTPKQRLFAQNYVEMLNGARAVIKAGYSEAGASVTANNLLRNANVKIYIEKLFAAGKMGKAEVIGRLQALANADIGAYIETVMVLRNGVEVEEWRFNLVKALKDNNTHLIKSIKRDRYGVVVELHDKVKTLELIGKHHRLFADITIAGEKPDQTAEDLTDDQLAAIAASQDKRTRDVVDSFEADDPGDVPGADPAGDVPSDAERQQ